MPSESLTDTWSNGDAYEAYVGRWSRLVARDFLSWLGTSDQLRWLDVGTGTGALSAAIAAMLDPAEIVGVDASIDYVAEARRRVDDPRVRFEHGDAGSLRFNATFDVVVSGLVLNFVPDARSALYGMKRAVAPGGLVSGYVWDYAGRMEFMRHFWGAAVALDESARGLDEGVRFTLCNPNDLSALWHAAGLLFVETTPIDVATRFRDFDDYWSPFLGGQGPAPGYLMSLPVPQRAALREAVASSLPIAGDGSISMLARAWAVKGRNAVGVVVHAPDKVGERSGAPTREGRAGGLSTC